MNNKMLTSQTYDRTVTLREGRTSTGIIFILYTTLLKPKMTFQLKLYFPYRTDFYICPHGACSTHSYQMASLI